MSDEEGQGSVAEPRGRRRALKLAVVLVALLAFYALIGFFVVPRVVRWAVEKKGGEALHRTVTLGDVAFNPFTLRARLSALKIRDRDGQPLFSCDGLQLRLGPSGIFDRAWRLRELTLDGPALHVRFLHDGKLSIADLLTGGEASTPPRVIIDRLSIHGGELDYADESIAPAIRASFEPLNADVNDFVTIPGSHGNHALSVGFGRNTTARVTGTQTLDPLALAGRIQVSRLALADLAKRFAPGASVVIRSGEAEIAIDYDLRKNANGIQLRVTRGESTVTDLALASRATSAELLTVPRLEIRGTNIAFPARTVEIGSLRIDDPTGAIGWDPEGRFDWSSGTTAVATASVKSESTPPEPPSAKPRSPREASWKVRIAKTGIEGGTLHFEDQQTSPPVRFDLTGLTLSAEGVTNDKSVPVPFTLTGASGDGKVSLNGQVTPSPLLLDSRAKLDAIDLVPFQPYASAIKGLTLGAGTLDFDGTLRIAPGEPYLVEGDGALDGIELIDASDHKLLGCRKAAIRRVRLDGATSRFRIRSVDLDGLYANVVIDRQRNLNLSAIGEKSPPPPTAAPAIAKPNKSSVDIGTIDIRNATIDYRDDSLVLPFATAIRSAKGKVVDFSTTSRAAATVRLDGDVGEHGSVKVDGTMRMSDPFAGTDLNVHFRSVPMPTLSPYSAEFAGYAIERGDLDLDVRYRIVNRKLTGDHRIVATDFTLGKRVSGTKAGFAVRLAVALLKDRDGRIDLQVPIEGTIDSPEFNYRAVMWQAVKKILGNIVKAPFRALGRLMGMGGEDLQVVSFDAGDSTVGPPEQETLRKIAEELVKRPELELEIAGGFDSDLDVPAMKQTKFEALVAARRDVPVTEKSEPPSLDAILEALYAETFTPERLEQERAKFTTQPSTPPPPKPSRRFWQRKPPPPPPQPPAGFDASGFYDALRAQLVAGQTVSPDELRALAKARADAIAAALTSGGLPASRVKILDPVEVKTKAGSQRVALEMKLEAAGASAESPDD